jgi:prohibitin 2
MGISGLLSAVSLLGFLLFLLGIALVVISASQGRPVRGGILLAALGLVFGALLSVISAGILIVEPTQVAVVFNTLNGQLENPRSPGTHIVVPIVQTSTIYSTASDTYTQETGSGGGQGPVTARTSDGQEVLIEVSVLYRINPAQVNLIHQNWQNRYLDELVVPVLRGFVRDVVSDFRAEAVYSTSREEIQNEIEERMRERLSTEGLELTDLIVRDVSFSNVEFAEAIERVQTAERQAQAAEQEAEQQRIRAQGQSDARIIAAQGEAEATILQANAQAEALRLVSEQIAQNPNLIQYEYIRNLADNVRLVLVPSGGPFLFDFNSVTDGVLDEVEESEASPTQTIAPTATPAP